MKFNYIYVLLGSLFLFAACTETESLFLDTATDNSPINIEVIDNGFAGEGLQTRAQEIGYTTVFTSGDRIGIIGTGANNVPYRYDGSKWVAEESVTLSKPSTYSAYYPYSEEWDGMTIEQIKTNFQPQADQSTYANYTASDLMTATGVWNSGELLRFDMQHECAMLILIPTQRKYTYQGEEWYCNELKLDVAMSIGDELYKAWGDDEGYTRLLIQKTTAVKNVRYFYSRNGTERLNGEVSVEALSSGRFRRIIQNPNVETYEYNHYDAAVGDFLVRADNSMGYFFARQEEGFYPHGCIGIVFKVGAGQDDDINDYAGTGLSGSIRGYVVALRDAHSGAGAWGIRGVDEPDLENVSSPNGKYNGYTSTKAIRQLPRYSSTNVNTPTADGQYWAFKVASEYSAPALANSSGWYLPSINQLMDIHALSLNEKFVFAGGEAFKSTNDGRYWSSTELNNYDAWFFRFVNGSPEAYAKSSGYYLRPSYVRAVITF